VCLSVIINPRQCGDLGPLGAVVPWYKKITERPQNSARQNGDRKRVPYWGATMQNFVPGGTWHWSCVPLQYFMFSVCAEWTNPHWTVMPVCTQWHLEWPSSDNITFVSCPHSVFIHTNKENAKRGCQSGVPYHHLQFNLSKFTELRAQRMLGYKRSSCRNGGVICKSWLFVFVFLYLTAFGKYLNLKYENSVGNARAVGGHCRKEQLLYLKLVRREITFVF
jgi:hypothetical protein